MKAIKATMGITPTCWRPPYGDIDDRIRAIAQGLNLRTIIWGYDSEDWKNGINGITPAYVDSQYQAVIDSANNGTFSTVESLKIHYLHLFQLIYCLKHGAILLTHELNNYTMSEAIRMYPALKAAFKVSKSSINVIHSNLFLARHSYPLV